MYVYVCVRRSAKTLLQQGCFIGLFCKYDCKAPFAGVVLCNRIAKGALQYDLQKCPIKEPFCKRVFALRAVQSYLQKSPIKEPFCKSYCKAPFATRLQSTTPTGITITHGLTMTSRLLRVDCKARRLQSTSLCVDTDRSRLQSTTIALQSYCKARVDCKARQLQSTTPVGIMITHGVAMTNRLLTIIGPFYKRAL